MNGHAALATMPTTPPTPRTPDLMTVKEVAWRLDVHPYTVRRYIWAGKLKYVEVGGLVKVSQAAFDDFVRERVYPRRTEN